MEYLSVKQYADAHGLPEKTVRNWGKINEYLRDTCLTAQDQYKALITVYNSWIADKIDNYNSSFYYDSADCIYQSYLVGKPL